MIDGKGEEGSFQSPFFVLWRSVVDVQGERFDTCGRQAGGRGGGEGGKGHTRLLTALVI